MAHALQPRWLKALVCTSLRFAASPDFPVHDVPIAVVGHSAGGQLAPLGLSRRSVLVPRLWSQLRPVDCHVRLAVACGGVLDFDEAQEQGVGGGAGAVARFLQPLTRPPRGMWGSGTGS